MLADEQTPARSADLSRSLDCRRVTAPEFEQCRSPVDPEALQRDCPRSAGYPVEPVAEPEGLRRVECAAIRHFDPRPSILLGDVQRIISLAEYLGKAFLWRGQRDASAKGKWQRRVRFGAW